MDNINDDIDLNSPKMNININLPRIEPDEKNISLEKRGKVLTGHAKVSNIGNNNVMKNIENLSSFVEKNAKMNKLDNEEEEVNSFEKRGKKGMGDVRDTSSHKKCGKKSAADVRVRHPIKKNIQENSQTPLEKCGKKSMVDIRVHNVNYTPSNQKRGKKSMLDVRVRNAIKDDIQENTQALLEKRGKKLMGDVRVTRESKRY